MRDIVPCARYSSVCNVLRQWRIWLIPTYRVTDSTDSMIIINIIKEEIFILEQIKKLCERAAHSFYVLYMQACYIKT